MKYCFTTAFILHYYCFTTAEAICEEQVLIIVGETGSGKTTQIMQVPAFFCCHLLSWFKSTTTDESDCSTCWRTDTAITEASSRAHR